MFAKRFLIGIARLYNPSVNSSSSSRSHLQFALFVEPEGELSKTAPAAFSFVDVPSAGSTVAGCASVAIGKAIVDVVQHRIKKMK